MSKLFLHVEAIDDPIIRANFDRVRQWSDNSFPINFRGRVIDQYFESGDNTIVHGLKFVPKDAIVTRNEPNGVVEFKYSQWDIVGVVVNVSISGRYRILIGTYPEEFR